MLKNLVSLRKEKFLRGKEIFLLVYNFSFNKINLQAKNVREEGRRIANRFMQGMRLLGPKGPKEQMTARASRLVQTQQHAGPQGTEQSESSE